LPIATVIVSTGNAAQAEHPRDDGSMMIPVPKPATPPIREPTGAPTTRTTQPIDRACQLIIRKKT
jgi:hypothetical protein